MKANIKGAEIEGTPTEIAEVLRLLDIKPYPVYPVYPSYPIYPIYPQNPFWYTTVTCGVTNANTD